MTGFSAIVECASKNIQTDDFSITLKINVVSKVLHLLLLIGFN